ncbi:MAG: hypothetical protein ACRDPK_04840, partial [Carbonactinosporaceae bacterium]
IALGQLVAGGALRESDVTAWLTGAAAHTGLAPGEAARTIASGLHIGAKRPREVAARVPTVSRWSAPRRGSRS